LTAALREDVKRSSDARERDMRPLRVLGIDPGTRNLGYGLIEAHSRAHMSYVECGVISGTRGQSRGVRLGEIGRGLRELIEEMRPQVVAMEEAFFGLNVQSTIALGEARGVAIFVAAEYGLDIAGYPPATVKQSVAGNGRASKDQVARVVQTLLAMRRTPVSDAADALAIAICHGRIALIP